MALGARSADIARRVITQAAMPFCIGSVIGIGCGLACEKYFQALLFEVRGSDPQMLVLPVAALLLAAMIAALEPAAQAVRIDPAVTLRSE